MELDEKFWRGLAWDASLRDRWSDGSFPEYREMMQFSNEKLQESALKMINELKKARDPDPYFHGLVMNMRIEMAWRLREGKVAFPPDQSLKETEPQRTKDAITFCVVEYKKASTKPPKKTLARKAVDEYLSFLTGEDRERKIESIRQAFNKKLPKELQ